MPWRGSSKAEKFNPGTLRNVLAQGIRCHGAFFRIGDTGKVAAVGRDIMVGVCKSPRRQPGLQPPRWRNISKAGAEAVLRKWLSI